MEHRAFPQRLRKSLRIVPQNLDDQGAPPEVHRILCSLLVFLLPLGIGAETPTSSLAAAEELFPLDSVRARSDRLRPLRLSRAPIPERFEVEVLGVWRNTQPSTSFILARLKGRGLEASGVIAGMSGSPVYVDGRLAGCRFFLVVVRQRGGGRHHPHRTDAPSECR